MIDQPNLRTPVIGFLPPPSIYAAVVKVCGLAGLPLGASLHNITYSF